MNKKILILPSGIIYTIVVIGILFFFSAGSAEAAYCQWIGSQANYMKCQCWNGSWGYGTSERNALNQCPSQPPPPSPPTATLKVRNTTDGSSWTTSNITIDYSDQIALNWSSSNASSCSGSYFSASGTSGTQSSVSEPSAGSYKNYKITCTGPGGSASDTLRVTRSNNLPSATLKVRNASTGSSWTTSNITIDYDDEIQLNWSSTNSTSCSASGSSFSTGNATGGTDTSIGEPSYGSTNTYKVTCTGPGGSRSDSLTVTRTNPPSPTATLKVQNATTGSSWTTSNITIIFGEQVSLNWSSTNSTSCSASGSGFSASGTGGTDTSISEPGGGATNTYTVTCTGPGGSVSDSLTVTTQPIPTATLEVQNTSTGSSWTSSDITIQPTDEISLRWSSTNATTCSGSNFSTSNTTSGTLTDLTEPDAGDNIFYSLLCSGYSQQDSDSLRVTVQAGVGANLTCNPHIVRSNKDVSCHYTTGTSDPATCSIRIGNSPITGYSTLSNNTGDLTYTVTAESTFTLDCEDGSNADQETVTVLPVFEET